MALRNLLVRVGADLSGLQKGMKQAQSQMKGFAGKINGILAAIGTGLTLKGGIQDAMKFESLMGTLSQSLGDSMKDFIKWQNTVGASLGYSKLQSAELANTLSLNFKQIATSQKDLLEKTTKMMETAAVISSKRGMAMTEVSDRIRSAMNQEADGADELGVNVRVTAMEQSNAYKQMADGRPWAELSTNMQKAILYHHILESVSTNLGDTLQNNTQMKMSAFTASLADVRMALGSAFLPILNVVLPVLTAFMRKIEVAFKYVAAFTRALFGGGSALKQQKAQTAATNAQSAAVGGLGKAIKKTGKEVAKAAKVSRDIAGFDEINQLADHAGSDGGSGGGADTSGVEGSGSIPMPIPDPGPTEGAFGKISKKIQEFANQVKKFFSPVIQIFKDIYGVVKAYLLEKFDYVEKFWKENAAQMAEAWQNFKKIVWPIIVFIAKIIWDSIKGAIDGLIDVVLGLVEIFTGIFTRDWKKVWSGVKKVVIGAIKAVWNIINLLLIGKAIKGILGFGKTIITLFKSIGPKMNRWWAKGLEAIKSNAKQSWDYIWYTIKRKFAEMVLGFRMHANLWLEQLLKPFKSIYSWFKTNVADKIASAIAGAKNTVASKAENIWIAIKGKFTAIYDWFKTNVGDKIISAIANVKDATAGKAADIWTAIKGKFVSVYEWFRDNLAKKPMDALQNWKDSIAGKASSIWSAIKGKFTGVYDWFRDNVAKKPMEAFNNWRASIANAAGNVWSAIKGKFTGVYNWFKSNVVDKISSAFSKIKYNITEGLYNSVKGLINKLIDFINKPIKQIKGWSFMGAKPFKNLPTIPKLAQGGYVGANSPVLAMIGDNRTEGEIVAPESKLYEQTYRAIKDALSQNGGNSGPIEVTLQLNETKLGKVAISSINKVHRQSGKILLNL
jgi:hypothetical protein